MSPGETTEGGREAAYKFEQIKRHLIANYGEGVNNLTPAEQEELSVLDAARVHEASSDTRSPKERLLGRPETFGKREPRPKARLLGTADQAEIRRTELLAKINPEASEESK